MNWKSWVFSLVLTSMALAAATQDITVRGIVTDAKGMGLFAVNVFLQNQSSIGTVTNLNGEFSLSLDLNQTGYKPILVFSSMGFKPIMVLLDSIDLSLHLNIILTETSQSLDEVVVEANKSISREFSTKEMDKLKIYLSPLSSGDPLKAIAMLPSSTNINETANPELRGSNANRTKVFFNGVPVSNPVRNSQLNGIGFFSLFNPEMIKDMRVYPSNPPLIYGNSSAGMIDIETQDKLDENNLQISVSLASVGINCSRKTGKQSFIQVYGNHQFSGALIKVNPVLHQRLKRFDSDDFGLNFHAAFGKNITFNFYNYLIAESSEVMLNLFTWEDHSKARTIRDFSIVNLKYQNNKNLLWIDAGSNFNHSRFSFGNICSRSKQQQYYCALNYKYLIFDKLSIQSGINNDNGHFQINNQSPVYYYALSPGSPYYIKDSLFLNNLTEGYIYLRYKPLTKVILGVGLRKSIKLGNKNYPGYTSLQANSRLNISNNQSIMLSLGRYHNVTEPSYQIKKFNLLTSSQVAIEYQFENNKTNINLAAYYKQESGDTSGSADIKGFEFYVEQSFGRAFKTSISNTFLNSDVGTTGNNYQTGNDLGYFFVATISYYHPLLFNISLSWSSRKGTHYTPINSAILNSDVGFNQPIYNENSNSAQLPGYNTINLSISRVCSLKDNELIIYASVFNLLDNKNPKGLIYNSDYTNHSFDYFQRRSAYFGFMVSF